MKIQGTTRILGIFGDPVAHSLSPAMQNEALRQAGVDAVYVPFHVPPDQLPAAMDAIRALGIWGVNLTIPHKEAVCAHLDEIDTEAQRIGAVNTVVNHDGKLTGFNTDAPGLLRSLAEDLEFSPDGKQILLLGAGGACRAALAALGSAGAAWVGIANRTRKRAEELASRFSRFFPGTHFATLPLDSLDPTAPSQVPARIDLLVNTTSVGLRGESFTELPWGKLHPGGSVYDMVYTRGGTPLLQAAEARGFRRADGLGMLVAQGEEAFFLWTGVKPPLGAMRERVLSEFSR
jgi:shikimate dehydrogenase